MMGIKCLLTRQYIFFFAIMQCYRLKLINLKVELRLSGGGSEKSSCMKTPAATAGSVINSDAFFRLSYICVLSVFYDN